jgi:hypothetical protein
MEDKTMTALDMLVIPLLLIGIIFRIGEYLTERDRQSAK